MFNIEEIDTLKCSGIGTIYELDIDIKDSVKEIIKTGFTTFYTGLKEMFFDSKNIFTEIYGNLGDSAKIVGGDYAE